MTVLSLIDLDGEQYELTKSKCSMEPPPNALVIFHEGDQDKVRSILKAFASISERMEAQ